MLQVVRERPALAFLIAVAAVFVATLVRWAITPLIGPTSLPYLFYFPAVALVGLTGSLPAALFATALAAAAADLLFIATPVISGGATLPDRIGFAAFFVTGGAIAALTARLDSALMREADGRRVAIARGDTLEQERSKLERESRRLSLLADVSSLGVVNPTFTDVAQHAARRVAENIGDACIIRVLDAGRLVVVAVHHVALEAMPFLEKVLLDPEEAAGNEFYARLIETRRTLSFASPARDDLRERVPRELRHLYDRYAARQAAVSPVQSGDALLGTLSVFRAENVPYSETDLRAMEAVASRVALALENARLFEKAQGDAEEARQARAAAEEASRVKDEFLATLSHELRTPLNAIVGWAHMLRDPRLSEDRRQAAIETIVRNAQSQEQLIADILDVQRIMAGKLRLTLRNADLSDIVRAAAETVQPSAEVKQIRLQLLVDLDVTPIWGDADRLQQVAWNLLSNAIKFTPKGGRVQVRLARSESHCEMTVEDNGPGIAPEFIPYMFERFRQADSSSTRTHKGLGLGLAIVRSLVEMHGGTVTAGNVTDPGRTGAVFTILLPRNAARMPAAEGADLLSAEQTPAWLPEAPSLDGVRVLVVDDDPDARELIGTILERCGADVMIAGSAEEGMTALSKRTPHVIVTDIEMPHEDGFSFIRRIRAMSAERGGRLPAAALTAYASAADRMKVLAAGFNMHVAKPVQPAELAMIVASLAGKPVVEELRTKN